MEPSTLIGIAALFLALVFGGGMLYFVYFAPKPVGNLRGLMGDGSQEEENDVYKPGPGGRGAAPTAEQLEGMNRQLQKKIKKSKPGVTQEEKFFRAGFFTPEDRTTFFRIKYGAPLILAPLFGAIGIIFLDATSGLVGLVMGVLLGAQMPNSYIDRKIKRRDEDIMFYLPLVIEQIVIGVSSSLDTGPCIQRVVAMADERNSHNPVTELLRHAQMYAKSGISFEEAMNDVGTLSNHTELKHAFKSLAQVAKHGGEITKQLQELADSVSSQRETKIEAKIKKLELEATGPVGLVFFGFMIILLVGLGANMMKAFK